MLVFGSESHFRTEDLFWHGDTFQDCQQLKGVGNTYIASEGECFAARGHELRGPAPSIVIEVVSLHVRMLGSSGSAHYTLRTMQGPQPGYFSPRLQEQKESSGCLFGRHNSSNSRHQDKSRRLEDPSSKNTLHNRPKQESSHATSKTMVQTGTLCMAVRLEGSLAAGCRRKRGNRNDEIDVISHCGVCSESGGFIRSFGSFGSFGPASSCGAFCPSRRPFQPGI